MHRLEKILQSTGSLAMGLLLAVTAVVLGTPQNLKLPRQTEVPMSAAVTIKTQAAADSIQGGIRGIDVSKYQGTINWPMVATDNVNFVMARASIGMETDEYFYYNATNAHSSGILVGAYHYAKFTDYSSMMAEAKNFISQLRQVNITYPVALDVEANRGLSRSELTRLCKLFLEELRAAGYQPLLYSYSNFFRDYLDMASLTDTDLWVANYNEEPLIGQKIWQHTSYGSVSGITGRVDINIAYGDNSNRVIRVDSDISRSIKQTLNDRYNAGLSLDTLDMSAMNAAVAVGLQSEVNRQFGVSLPIYSTVSESAMSFLESINYVRYQTRGNITYLIQVKLFYKGLYNVPLTGILDDSTATGLWMFQLAQGIPATGNPDSRTLRALLM